MGCGGVQEVGGGHHAGGLRLDLRADPVWTRYWHLETRREDLLVR